MVDIVNTALVIVASISFLVAIYFTYRLSGETRGGRYWLAFVVAAIGLGVHEWLKIVNIFISIRAGVWRSLVEAGVVIGALSLAYGAYGIQRSVAEIKRKTGG